MLVRRFRVDLEQTGCHDEVFTNECGVFFSQSLELVECTTFKFFECDVFIDRKVIVFFTNGTKLTGTKLLRR